MKRKGESFLERKGRMVKCEEEENGENGEGGGPSRFLRKEGVGFVVKEGGRARLVEEK